MYFENLSLSNKLIKSLKKNFAVIYRNSAPTDIEIVDIKVPIHLPNSIPDNNSIGEPNPKSITQQIVNIKNNKKLNIIFLPIISSILACINL